jgi:mitochondrial fission protein ELM1
MDATGDHRIRPGPVGEPTRDPGGDASGSDAPTVWALLDDRPGNTTQAVGLSESLGWPTERKQLNFNRLAELPNWLLGATRRTVDRAASDTLTSPWPDVIISAGRRTAPLARWIRKQNLGQTRLIQLGRKGGNIPDAFDAVVTPLHTRLPPHPHRIETLGPLNPISPERLAWARSRWPDLVDGLRRPLTVLLVGGSTPRYTLDARLAARIGSEVSAFAESQNGSLVAVTSRRTGPEASRALSDAVGPAAEVRPWEPGVESPYPAYLAHADILVVTGESESMLAEIAAVGKPMYIYPLPQKPPTPKTRVKEWMLARALSRVDGADRDASWWNALAAPLCAALIDRGIVLPPRRIALMHQALVDRGLAGYLDRPPPATPVPPLRETPEVAARLQALLGL